MFSSVMSLVLLIQLRPKHYNDMTEVTVMMKLPTQGFA